MEIIVKAWTPEGKPYREVLTYDLEDAIARFSVEVRLGHRVSIEAKPSNH